MSEKTLMIELAATFAEGKAPDQTQIEALQDTISHILRMWGGKVGGGLILIDDDEIDCDEYNEADFADEPQLNQPEDYDWFLRQPISANSRWKKFSFEDVLESLTELFGEDNAIDEIISAMDGLPNFSSVKAVKKEPESAEDND